MAEPNKESRTADMPPYSIEEIKILQKGKSKLVVRVDFTEEQLNSMRTLFASASYKLEREMSLFDSEVKLKKEQFKKTASELSQLSKKIESRGEDVEADCYLVPDKDRAVMLVYSDVGTPLYKRAMTDDERRSSFDFPDSETGD